MKLSIITINRNNAIGLRKTIESVVYQTFTDFEYIVIDGASTDESVEIIREYSKNIHYWVSEQDNGIYNAMNKGIKMARGEYLQFLNSGDVLSESDVLFQIFNDQGMGSPILSGKMRKIYQDGTLEVDSGQLWNRVQQNSILTLYDFYKGTLNHSCTFIRKEIFAKYGFYDESMKIVSDWAFFMKVIGIYGEKVKFIDIVVTDFDMSGISNTNQTLLYKERRIALKETIPSQILADYDFFHEIYCRYIALDEKYKFLFHFRIVRVVTKIMNNVLRRLTGMQ